MKKNKHIAIRVDDRTYQHLVITSKKFGLSVSDLIRQYIFSFIIKK